MTRRARSGGALVLLMLLGGCAREPETLRHAFFALGTLVEISVYDPSPGAVETLRAVEAALLADEHRWRAWEDGGLAALNRRLAAGETVALDEEFAAGIRRASEISERSGGRFNPAIGRLVELWGFHQEERPPGPPPTAPEIAALLPPPDPAALVQDDDGRWHGTDPRLWLDMGAFAKGLAIEKAIAILQRNDITNAIVNAGGDLKVLGAHGERAWRIGVRQPRSAGVLAALQAFDGESVFTSGDYERFFEWNGTRYHHILDPATGQPVRGLVSVTVIHADAALADAAATALMVAGPAAWPATARALGISHVMAVLDDGRVQLTPAMQARVQFEQDPQLVEIVAP